MNNNLTPKICKALSLCLVINWQPHSECLYIMPYYGLFWTWSPYLDLQWRSLSTGTIPELLITSIVFIVLCSDISLVLWTLEISLHKTIHMISTGDPPSNVLVILCILIIVLKFKRLICSMHIYNMYINMFSSLQIQY